MKEQKELIEKVKSFLNERKILYNDNSIEYIGLRENYKIGKDDPKDYYFISYDILSDKSNKYSTKSYFVYIEKKSLRLIYIIGPQTIERIEE